MFTGLVEEVGRIARIERTRTGARLAVESTLGRAEPLVLGESIAVMGVCLTVDRMFASGFEADASSETLVRTTLGKLGVGSHVNLERATKLGGRMGGHTVLGHVDGVGRLVGLERSGEAQRTTIEIPRELASLVAEKGSITLDGVSLTVNRVTDDGATRVELMLIPHTLSRTTLPALRVGSEINVEVDVLARYVQRHLALAGASAPAPNAEHPSKDSSLLEKLKSGGYV